jgi:hypothetical protein
MVRFWHLAVPDTGSYRAPASCEPGIDNCVRLTASATEAIQPVGVAVALVANTTGRPSAVKAPSFAELAEPVSDSFLQLNNTTVTAMQKAAFRRSVFLIISGFDLGERQFRHAA